MSTIKSPYVDYSPGDLITAEAMNQMQCEIQEDISKQVDAAKSELVESGVSRADDADKFNGKSDTDWLGELDQRYAPNLHDHEGLSVYKRYFKRFTPELDAAFIHHKLGRFPLVDTYRLLPLESVAGVEGVEVSEQPVRFFLYYAHEEADRFDLNVRVFRERVAAGIPIETILNEFGVDWTPNDTFQDVRNELWDALFSAPNDEMGHATSPWAEEKCIERLKIKELMDNDEWPDIRVAFAAQKVEVIPENEFRQDDNNQLNGVVRITHVNYETVVVNAEDLRTGDNSQPLDLMFLMRI